MSEQTDALITTEQEEDAELLTVSEAARLTKRHQNTIRRWIYQGHLPAQKVGRLGHFRIRRGDLEAALTYTRASGNDGADQ